jgi:DNA-binding FadR family transcriptional regulator
VIAWRLQGRDGARQLHWLSELRAAVEPKAARLAASAATPEQWGALTEAVIALVTQCRDARSQAYLEADVAFHRRLLEASGNPMFAALGGVIDEVLRGRAALGLMPQVAKAEAIRWHADLAAAISAGDAEGAEAAARAIVDESDEAAQAGQVSR